MTKTKNSAIQRISEHFDKYKGYVSNPPEEEILGWVLHYMNKYDYESILKIYGIRYLLIIMYLLELGNDFELCSKIVLVIEDFNQKNSTTYPTHLRKLKKLY